MAMELTLLDAEEAATLEASLSGYIRDTASLIEQLQRFNTPTQPLANSLAAARRLQGRLQLLKSKPQLLEGEFSTTDYTAGGPPLSPVLKSPCWIEENQCPRTC